MASTATLKELARDIVVQRDIDAAAARTIIDKLTRPDLKQLLLYVRLEIRRRRVMVTAADNIETSLRGQIERMFPGTEISFARDPSLGGGIRVEHGDDIIDVSVKGLLQRTYQTIKERL